MKIGDPVLVSNHTSNGMLLNPIKATYIGPFKNKYFVLPENNEDPGIFEYCVPDDSSAAVMRTDSNVVKLPNAFIPENLDERAAIQSAEQMLPVLAVMRMMNYKAHLDAGFTEEQALYLCDKLTFA